MKRTTLLLVGLAALAAASVLGGDERASLHELAGEMTEVKAQLDAEHHGSRVLVAQKDITDKLDAIIKKLQEPPPPGGGDPGCPGPKRNDDQQPGAGPNSPTSGQPGPRRQVSPAQREALTTGGIEKGRMGTADVSSTGGEWGRLSARRRAELTMAAAEQMPARYRKLLEFYYLSIAEEEK